MGALPGLPFGPGALAVMTQMPLFPHHTATTSFFQEPVTALAWAGDSILCAVPGGYTLVSPGSKPVPIAAGVTTRTLVASHPPTRRALLLFGDAMVGQGPCGMMHGSWAPFRLGEAAE